MNGTGGHPNGTWAGQYTPPRTQPATRGIRRLDVLAELARHLDVDPIDVRIDNACSMQVRPEDFRRVAVNVPIQVVDYPDAGHAVLAIRFGESTVTTFLTRHEAAALVSA